MRIKIIFFLALILLGSIIISAAIHFDIINKKTNFETHIKSIEKRISISEPNLSKSKYPVVLMFHGCGGTFNHQEFWADKINSIGFIAAIVDSYKERNLDAKAVCSGYQFRGSQRAADVLSAIAYIKKLNNVDINNIYLSGWSHGAWSIMDAVAFLSDSEPASGMKNLQENLSVNDISGTILFYPYCNKWISQSAKRPWNGSFNSLFLFAENDRLTDNQVCHKIIKDKNIKHTAFTLKNTEHAFDYPDNLSHVGITANPKAREKSVLLVQEFLTTELSR